jgi:glycosyltransferase involved in cell wall biosynthesis
VVHLDHSVEHGGAQLALRRLLTNDGRRWSAEVSVPAQDGRLGVFGELQKRGVLVTPTGVAQRHGAIRGGVRATPWVAWGLLRQAVAIRASGMLRRADVVHTNTSRSALFGAIAVLGTRTPLVVHVRDHVEPDALGRIGCVVFRAVVSRRASAYIANSESTAATVRGSLRRGQSLRVIPSPIGVERASTYGAAAGDGPVRIGMVARLDAWKGQHLVIRAFAQAGLDGLATLTFFGDASLGDQAYADSLRSLARDLGLRGVFFAGFVDDVSDAIDGLDVAVQYSLRSEPFGQNVLQYLARGRVVVAAREGGPTEWIRDGVNGLLVAPRDPAALGRVLRALVEDPTRRDALAAGALATPGLPADTAVTAAVGDYFRLLASPVH